ncbi:hypothetical protein Landi51_12765 [Colletotrichum acutatum]
MDALFASPSRAIPLPIATLPAATGISGISQKGKLGCQSSRGQGASGQQPDARSQKPAQPAESAVCAVPVLR